MTGFNPYYGGSSTNGTEHTRPKRFKCKRAHCGEAITLTPTERLPREWALAPTGGYLCPHHARITRERLRETTN